MGSGEGAPEQISGNTALFGTPDREVEVPLGIGGVRRKVKVRGKEGIAGAKELFDRITQQMNSGLPSKLREDYVNRAKGSIGGQLRSGEQSLKERFAGMGDVPIGAMNDAYTKLRGGANQATNEFMSSLLEKDYGAQQDAVGQYFNLTNLGQGAAGNQNSYNLNKYQIDESNKFSFGKLLGGLVQAGGQVGGAMAGRPGKYHDE